VVLTGYLPLADIPVLLSGAEALVFPSLDEGFGLPLVEAMACRCPVITSTVSAMQEVAGEAAILVDPLATEAIHAAMERVYRNQKEKDALRAKGAARAEQYSWERAARRTLEVLQRVGES
jgi:glycosyltransferase involved in cell wall biosynthesis